MVNATSLTLHPRERGEVPVVQEAGWWTRRTGLGGYAASLSHAPDLELRTADPVASRCAGYAVPAALYKTLKILCT